MKIKKMLSMLIILTIIGLIVFVKFYPQVLDQEPIAGWRKKLRAETQKVLGAQTTNLLESFLPNVIDSITNLPIIQDISNSVETKIDQEIENLKKKPEEGIKKIKGDVKETVCEDWLAE